MPIDKKFHAVPHLKALINGIYTSCGPRDGSLCIKTMLLGRDFDAAGMEGACSINASNTIK